MQKKNFNLLLLVSLFLILSSSVENTDTSDDLIIPKQSSMIPTVDANITITYTYGNPYFEYFIPFLINYGSGPSDDRGFYALATRNMYEYYSNNIFYDISTNTITSQSYVVESSYKEFLISDAGQSYFSFMIASKHRNLLLNNTNTLNYFDDSLGSRRIILLGSYAKVGATPSDATWPMADSNLFYSLETRISINSTYYNKGNTRFIFKSGNSDWQEQDNNNIVLNCPYYKLRVYNLENQLLFEDSEYQLFSKDRFINITSLRIQNNADEPIITSIYENHGHYQGTESFNNKSATFDFSANCKRSINDLDNHSNVLNLTFFADAEFELQSFSDVSSDDTTVEFWLKSSTSMAISLTSNIYYTTARIYFTEFTIYFYNGTNPWDTYVSNSGEFTHIRFVLSFSTQSYDCYVNNILAFSNLNFYSAAQTSIDSFSIVGWTGTQGYLDALDYSWSEGYYINRNTELNHTEAIYEIIANSNYNHTGHYQGAYSFDNDIVNTRISPFSYVTNYNLTNYLQLEKNGHSKVMFQNSTGNITDPHGNTYYDVGSQTVGTIEFWLFLEANNFPDAQTRFWFTTSTTGFSGILLYFTKTQFYLYNNTPTTVLLQNSNQFDSLWHHYRISFDCASGYSVYKDSIRLTTSIHQMYSAPSSIRYIKFVTVTQGSNYYLDALDFSWSSGYFINRNMLENQSTSLENWYAYPNWVTNEYKNSVDTIFWGTSGIPSNVNKLGTPTTYEICNFSNHLNVVNITSDATSEGFAKYFTNQNHLYFSFYIYPKQTNKWITVDSSGTSGYAWGFALGSAGKFGTYSKNTGWIWTTTSYSSQWYHIIVDATNASDIFYYVNSVFLTNRTMGTTGGMRDIRCISDAVGGDFYLDALTISSSISNCYLTQLENTTYSMLAMNYTAAPDVEYNPILTLQTNPYSSTLSNFTSGLYLYRYFDLYNNEIDVGTMFANESELIFTPPNVRENFISIHDQQANYMDWEQFRIKINDTLIYENRFYREIGTTWNISLYNQYDLYLTSTLHTVDRDENYIAMQVIKRSLKIYNQQEEFLHVNITYDPNYYDLPYFWSNWLAPKESREFYLLQDYYSVGISNFENGSAIQYFAYNLINDDILMISSANTLYNVLANLENVNTTLGTQFTYVALNFTNTNSAIGNQTTLIQINFQNINSTFENSLLSQQYSFEFMNSSFATLFLNQNNSFSFINTSLDNIYVLSQNNFNAMNLTLDELVVMGENSFLFTNSSLNQIIAQNQNGFEFLNSSVNNLFAIQSNSFTFINSTTATLLTQSTNSFEFLNSTCGSIYALSLLSFAALNSSIENISTTMLQNFSFVSSEIGENQLEILTQFQIVQSNITNNSIDIMNQVVAVNSSISDLIVNLQNNVLLVNDSIYTAVLDVSTNLAIDSTYILGNLSITFRQNEFLTEIYKKTMFSDLLYNSFNWTDLGYNWSQFVNEVDSFAFVNKYRNQSVEVLLRYLNATDSILVGSQPESDWLPTNGVEYRLKSLNTGEYLSDWEDLSNTTIEFGNYTEIIPATPGDLNADFNDWILVVTWLIGFIIAAVIAIVLIAQRTNRRTTKHEIFDTSRTYRPSDFGKGGFK